jgi:hypothetical protein
MKQFNISLIWRQPTPADLAKKLRGCIERTCDRAVETVCVFFRDDDVAAPGTRFAKMMGLFEARAVPISLAVVPAWLTRCRWQQMRSQFDGDAERWCWHQHGWRHANHENTGKKQEFGPSRSTAQLTEDLLKGRTRLEKIIGKNFYPVFTPPWNRCSADALRIIKDLGYKAVSRSRSAHPPALHLSDLQVNIDLHTRKDAQFLSGWQHLLQEIESSLSRGRCGIMLHHRQMNAAAFAFLEVLLKLLVAHPKIRLMNFRDLLENTHAKSP